MINKKLLLAIITLLAFFFPQQGLCEGQFAYTYKTEIAFNQENALELDSKVENIALKKNKYLNQSVMFDPAFIKDIRKVREYHLEQKSINGVTGKIVDNIVTQDHVQIYCTYFDRGKDKLVIVGEGFTNERELMTPYVAMFEDYDVVLFDFRGQGFKDFNFCDLETWRLNLAQNTFGMDSGLASLGQHEEKDVFAVVDYFKKCKPYKKVYGVSLCYSSFIFLKAQAIREEQQQPLFDKIIVDGCWLDVPRVVEKLKKDLKMICSPQHGGWNNVWPLNREWMQNIILFLTEHVWGLPIHSDVSILDYVGKIKATPVLFFHGKNDLMVTREEFEMLWQHIGTPEKAAVITSNPHVRNHLKQKELYKLIADLFLELSYQDFRRCLLNSEELVAYEVEKIKNLIG